MGNNGNMQIGNNVPIGNNMSMGFNQPQMSKALNNLGLNRLYSPDPTMNKRLQSNTVTNHSMILGGNFNGTGNLSNGNFSGNGNRNFGNMAMTMHQSPTPALYKRTLNNSDNNAMSAKTTVALLLEAADWLEKEREDISKNKSQVPTTEGKLEVSQLAMKSLPSVSSGCLEDSLQMLVSAAARKNGEIEMKESIEGAMTDSTPALIHENSPPILDQSLPNSPPTTH